MSDDDLLALFARAFGADKRERGSCIPAATVAGLRAVERAARSAERDSISMELALIPNAYQRRDLASAYSRGVNDCRERIVDRGLRARAEGR